VKRVLLTGMSGTGKSTVIEELAARGYKAVDTDYHGLTELVDVPDDDPTSLAPGQDWLWREDRIQVLLSTDDVDLLFLSGCAPNQVSFYPQFDHIILLTASAPVIAARLTTRTNNPYGQQPHELARVLHLQRTIEPLLKPVVDLEIDTSIPIDQVVATILRHVQVRPTTPR
jgi:shikimate kinase